MIHFLIIFLVWNK